MKAAILLCALMLVGCDGEPSYVIDKKLRSEIFFRCLAALPKGPEHTKNSNDWDEVVAECGSQAYAMAITDGRQK